MKKVLELVFGSGRYGCLEKTVAFTEPNKGFVEVWFVVSKTCYYSGLKVVYANIP